MSKLLSRFSYSLFKQSPYRAFGVSSYSTRTQPDSPDTLYHRLQICREQRGPLTPILDKWVVEGRPVDYGELKRFIKTCRKTRRFKPALELSEWLIEMKYSDSRPGLAGLHLDLISKVHGPARAQQYFDTLDPTQLVPSVHGALLNSYADANDISKAEAIFNQIRTLHAPSNLDYNTMLSLYSRTGNHRRLDSLAHEMEEKGIELDEFTYNIRLNSHATNSDLRKMERLLMKMELDPHVTVNCHAYITAAKGYIKARLMEKAMKALGKAEHSVRSKERQTAYSVLITVYAAIGEREHVYRVWTRLKRDGRRTYYRGYGCMIASLEKLGDFEGLGKIFEQWAVEEKKDDDGERSYLDMRVPNAVIWAYCRKGMVKEAEAVLGRAVGEGGCPSASTWSHMALGYLRSGEMERAVEMTKQAARSSFAEWRPDFKTVGACVEYLKEKGDSNGVREILMLFERCGKFSEGLKERADQGDEEMEADEALEAGAS
ncbi:Pentatricopeptide repeat-containing protein -mitochondrial [Striga hermonthica]|uniref:Pentatricopeptide repeat-containing protein -mitochondrial n=1 Tax=Striga hermonthica TaxID=68872 RepID=A0A9N7NU53_STRHE|nr:Pentatricopeptide repeat-containing protein -mitochondrial [Striga hermonthica]